jgi:hypothetical protein
MWWEGEEDDVSRYKMTLRKWEDTVDWQKKHEIGLYGELALQDDMDLSDKTTERMNYDKNERNFTFMF